MRLQGIVMLLLCLVCIRSHGCTCHCINHSIPEECSSGGAAGESGAAGRGRQYISSDMQFDAWEGLARTRRNAVDIQPHAERTQSVARTAESDLRLIASTYFLTIFCKVCST